MRLVLELRHGAGQAAELVNKPVPRRGPRAYAGPLSIVQGTAALEPAQDQRGCQRDGLWQRPGALGALEAARCPRPPAAPSTAARPPRGPGPRRWLSAASGVRAVLLTGVMDL